MLAERTFTGAGEMARLCREKDWAATPLGPVEAWPQSLVTATTVTLASGLPTVLLWGPELTQIYNDAAARILGGRHPDALGAAARTCWADIWDRAAPVIARAMAGDTVLRRDSVYPLSRHDPFPRYFTVSFAPLRDEVGAVSGVLISAVETTEEVGARAEAERARDRAETLATEVREHRSLMDAVLDQMPSGISIAEAPSGRVVYRNDEAIRLLGHAVPLDASVEAEGQHGALDDTGELLHAGDHPLMRAVRGAVVTAEEFMYRRPDGTVAHLSVNAAPVRNDQGDIVAAVSTYHDISDRKVAEEALRRAKETAERASEVKSQFLSTMSHELRTPLTAVTGLSDLLETEVLGPLNDEQKKQLNRIRSSAWHLVRIIDEILTFSRTEAGKEQIRTAAVDIGDVVRSVAALLEAEAEIKGVSLTVDVPDDIQAVDTDEGKLRQIAMNLIGNAVKFTDAGRVDVVLSVDQAQLTIAVQDTGPGIAPEWIEAIFDPFIQVDNSTTRSKGGTGLGLTVSRKLARLLGGDVHAESQPGIGSTFALRLPIRR